MLEKILDLIKKNDNFVITSHVNPDGDSIGSEIALYRFLQKQGKKTRIINYSPTPDNYLFLDEGKIIEEFDETIHRQPISEAGVIFVLDTNEYSRLRTMEKSIKESPAKKVCIDHHLGSSNGFDFYISDTNSPATGEILFKLLTLEGQNNINNQIAVPLYTAIMTDTGSFRFPRTDSETHMITAKLIEEGADPVKIYTEVYDKSPLGRLVLLSRFLNNMKLSYEGRLIYSFIYLNDFTETGTNVFDTEGFSHHLMSVDTVQIAVIFTQTERGVKISFRSRGEIYVNELAKEFGGGGHMNAAGAFLPGADLTKLTEEVILKSNKYIK